ncbi:ATP phosphoribosyltransferase regulatory subunit [Chloroflexota bacterium]
MKIPRSKGAKDWPPEEMAVFRFMERIFREQCRQWGYHEVRTPTIESLHLFTSAGTLTPSMLNRVYSFLDWDGWSGERVVLRPDGTIPIARFYIDRMSDRKLAKLYYITNIFIFEETGRENRERWQCGTELIGTDSPLADTELIALVLKVLQELGIEDVTLRLSHAGLIKSLLTGLGLSTEEQTAVFDRILDGDVATLAELKLKRPGLEDALPALLNLKGQGTGFLNNLKAVTDVAESRPHLDNFLTIVNYLESLEQEYQIDIASGAGFEYYTGIVFQFFQGDQKVGGGGRYDSLIPAMGGKATPACGFALYLERLLPLIKSEKAEPPFPEKIRVTVNPGENVPLKEILATIDALHQAGYAAEPEITAQRLPEVRWLLEMRESKPLFLLNDLGRGNKFEARDFTGVLKLLEAEDAHQNRPA